MVPLSSVVTTTWTRGPDLLPHFNGFTAAKIIGSAAPGYSSGDAIAAMESVAKEVLPSGLYVCVVGARVRGKEIRGHLGDRVPVRPDHRVPRAVGAVRVVDPAGRRDDRGAVRDPGRARDQLGARARERRLLPDRPAGADRPRREERRAARFGRGRIPQGGQVDHGGDGARGRTAAAADHHDVARLRDRLPAARDRGRAQAPTRDTRSAPASSAG